MKILRFVGLALVASLVSVFLWFNPLPSQAAQPTVRMQTEPALSQVVPNASPVRIALQAADSKGQPLSKVGFRLQLLTPEKTPWFTSDFPMVEGTPLLEFSAKAPTGTLAFEQVMPIRGNYLLKVQVTPLEAGAFEPFEQLLQLAVPERVVKYRNAAILIGILVLAGLLSGWILGGQQTVQGNEIAPQPVRLLLSIVTMIAIGVLLFVNISAELISTHHHDETPAVPTASMQRSPSLEIRLLGDQQATVGQLSTQAVQVINVRTGNPEVNAVVNAKSFAIEERRQIFAYQGRTDDQGRLTWREQFFDGSPHQIVAEVTTSNGSILQVKQRVEVEGIEPPLFIRLISLGYCTGIFVLSLVTGIWLHRRSSWSMVRLGRG